MNQARCLINDECVRASTFLEEERSMHFVTNLLNVNHSKIMRMVRRFWETRTNQKKRQGYKSY